MTLDLKQQKKRLEARKAELQHDISDLTEAYPKAPSNSASNAPGDQADMATAFLDMHQEQAMMMNEQALLTLIEQALERLNNGTYGYCQQCGQPIPALRLVAMPWAERDVVCEERLEQQNLRQSEITGEPQPF
jgi:DnaK suppressor protein